MQVTHELHQAIINAGCYPPRHKRGCPKNFARTLPLIFAARGMSIPEIKTSVLRRYDLYSCNCEVR